MLMHLFLFAALAAPPPEEGDDRTAILYAAKSGLDALVIGDAEVAAAWLTENAQLIVVDARKDGEPNIRISTFTATLDHMKATPDQREPMGIPTVLQDGALAQVWAPYSFWKAGEKLHCGSDNFTLVRRQAGWRIASVSFTMVPLERCDELAAPAMMGD